MNFYGPFPFRRYSLSMCRFYDWTRNTLIRLVVYASWYEWSGGLVVSALDMRTEGRGFEPFSGREQRLTISTPSSYMPLVEYKVDRVTLGDRQRRQMSMGDL